MATVTSLTASRMLEIEAASVIDGDVVGDNLILTKHDGTQINAGSVRGPQGTPGLPSADLPVIAAQPVLDIGLLGQIRAGRQLALADFTNMGLSAPLGLWNLGDLTDVSGNGRNLLLKGAASAGQGVGINGVAATAAKFAGTVGQALYIPDDGTGALAGAAFRIKTGSFGCWFRTYRRGTAQILIGKWSTTAANTCWILYITDTNRLHLDYSLAVSPGGVSGPDGNVDVCDDRWHFGVCTFDGTLVRLYTDGMLDVATSVAGHFNQGIGSLNIGIGSADAALPGATPNYGRIDEAFVTNDVLTDEQIRNLYCAKIPHTLGSIPSRISTHIRRRRRGGPYVVGDFSAQPLRLHNFTLGVMTDEGAHGIALNNSGGVETTGVDGTPRSAYSFFGTNQVLLCNDTNLPAGLAKRSYGCWFKTTQTVSGGLIGWGANQGDTRLVVEAPPTNLTAWNPGGAIAGAFVSDGLWHHAVVVEDDTDTLAKVRLYLDGRLVGSTNSYAGSALGGVNRFCVGRKPDSTASFAGQIDSVFVCGYAMTADEVYRLWNKTSGTTQTLAPSPKNAGDSIEALSATDILATFDDLDSIAQVDIGVAA